MSLAVTYFGQASLCLKSTENPSGSPEGTKAFRILVDPAFSSRNASPAEEISADILQADYILQTQTAADLLADVVELARRTEAQVICHSDLATWFVQQGAGNVAGMSLGSGATFPFGKVIMTLAHQSAASGYGDGASDGRAPLGTPVSYLVHFNDGLDVYIAGNSAQTADMELIGKAGGVDLAILPLGDQPYNGSDDALRAAQLVQAKHVLPLQCASTEPNDTGTHNEADVFAERLRRVAEIDTTILLSGQSAFF
jgi:L-ascorbate metabolism protein UlaG (beta-lactamase superfamily)